MRKKLSCKCEFSLIALSYDSYVTGRSGGDPSENRLRADDGGNGGFQMESMMLIRSSDHMTKMIMCTLAPPSI